MKYFRFWTKPTAEVCNVGRHRSDSNFPTPAVPLAGKDRGMLCALDKRAGTQNKWLLFPLLCLMCSLLLGHVNKLPSLLFNQWAELHGVL